MVLCEKIRLIALPYLTLVELTCINGNETLLPDLKKKKTKKERKKKIMTFRTEDKIRD